MRWVVGFRDRSTGMGTFGTEFGARHCNQWGLYGARVRQRRDAAFFPNYFVQICYYDYDYYLLGSENTLAQCSSRQFVVRLLSIFIYTYYLISVLYLVSFVMMMMMMSTTTTTTTTMCRCAYCARRD